MLFALKVFFFFFFGCCYFYLKIIQTHHDYRRITDQKFGLFNRKQKKTRIEKQILQATNENLIMIFFFLDEIEHETILRKEIDDLVWERNSCFLSNLLCNKFVVNFVVVVLKWIKITNGIFWSWINSIPRHTWDCLRQNKNPDNII